MRKYLAELLGTMILVALGTGAVVFAGTSYGPWPIAIGFGIALMAGIYAFGSISGGHFNPAVSLAAAINRRITWREFVGYVVAQIIGAFIGTAVLYGMMMAFGATKSTIQQVGFGQTSYSSSLNFFSAALIELFLTFVFVLVILMVTSKRNDKIASAAPVAIGLILAALIMVGLSSTGGSLNPARSLAPAVALALTGTSTALTTFAAYLVGPMVGGALAAVVAKYGLGSEEN